MDKLLTMEEIEAKYDGQWVVLTDIEDDPGPIVKRARVFWHGVDHEEAWDRASEVPPPKKIAVFYIGEIWTEGEPVPIL